MIRLSGFEPGVEVDIVYTGMRPGEKIYEELSLAQEMCDRTRCDKVFVHRGGGAAMPMSAMLEALSAPGDTPDDIRETLRRVLPEYRPSAPSKPAVNGTA
ncbi:MAG TPA: polysaccharide biosynthesis protein, partial [Planctomycetota bacterium]|nr:polysaccharide biosynthesis protein [Planctomycetota bacterium]